MCNHFKRTDIPYYESEKYGRVIKQIEKSKLMC